MHHAQCLAWEPHAVGYVSSLRREPYEFQRAAVVNKLLSAETSVPSKGCLGIDV